jgi:hypothetical protein
MIPQISSSPPLFSLYSILFFLVVTSTGFNVTYLYLYESSSTLFTLFEFGIVRESNKLKQVSIHVHWVWDMTKD